MNKVFKWKIAQFTFIDNNFKQKCNKFDKNSHKMSVMYFKGGQGRSQYEANQGTCLSHC